MQLELYFLRSSESKIVSDMLTYAYTLDALNIELKNVPQLKKMSDFYGLTRKDLGIYAMFEKKVVGAIWSRELEGNTPKVSMAVLPEYRKKGIGSQIMEQFLQEAGSVYKEIEVNLFEDSDVREFYTKFGFEVCEKPQEISIVDGSSLLVMSKKLNLKEVVRPSDGYDASYWIE